jgi:nicotinamidase-related amidase
MAGSRACLVLVDVINELDFPEAGEFFTHALPAARRIARLKTRAKRAGMPVIYANDNLGRWRSNFQDTLERCLRPACRGRPIAELLRPMPEDYFVLKPQMSAFHASPLELLLASMGAETVVLAGFAGDACVLLSAAGAHMRGLKIVVPSDCTASNTLGDNRAALAKMSKLFAADIRPSTRIRLKTLL